MDTSQPVISRAVTELTPLIEMATKEHRPDPEEAAAAVRGQSVLLDGFLAPCWSWKPIESLFSGKHKKTGFNCQLITDLRGNVQFISDPLPGRVHDMGALKKTPASAVLAGALSVIADKGYNGSDYLTPVKKPAGGELVDWQKKFNARLASIRAPVERTIAHIKAWRILHADYRRPLHTYLSSFRAAIGLYLFKLSFG
jgi:transposase